MPHPPVIRTLVVLALFSVLLAPARPTQAAPPAEAARLLVTFAPGQPLRAALASLDAPHLTVATTAECADAAVVTVPRGREAATAARLRATAGVESVEVDEPLPAPRVLSEPLAVSHGLGGPKLGSPSLPNDEFLSAQWNLTTVNAPEAWEYTTGATDALNVVAILDTGIDLDHPDLVAQVFQDAGWNYFDNNADVQDTSDTGSGTMVAGIIAATANNTYGVAGLNWNALIIPIKVIGRANNGAEVFYWSHVVAGICRAVDHGARVIHISAYSSNLSASVALTRAINYADQHGAILVAPIGDEGRPGNPVEYPAASSSRVISVTATDAFDHPWPEANYGAYLDFAAPGDGVATTYPLALDELGARRGTSTILATAHVSGLVMLLRAINPALTLTEIYSILRATASDIGDFGFDTRTGHGRINALHAIRSAPHRLAVSPSDLLVFEWDNVYNVYRQPYQTISNNASSAMTWWTDTRADWINVSPPTSATSPGSTPSIASVAVAPPRPGECGVRTGYVEVTSRMPNRVGPPVNIMVRATLPECPQAANRVFLPTIEFAPPRPVSTRRH